MRTSCEGSPRRPALGGHPRGQAGEEKTLISAIAPRGKATADLIKLGIKTVALAGADGLSFGFYDGATMERLRAIKQGMAEAEVMLRNR